MAGTIKVLSSEVIAAISAGEVVERPLSVVKELVDNAIDAQADRIEITIEGGGKSFIEVKDNGTGMSEEDLKLCLLKHATSKIASKEDLFNIRTMGFRGEALYSISQVSEISIISKRKDDAIGHKIYASGGEIINFSECGSSQGTTVRVENLFFNTPVRKKFLKSDNWEKSLIIEFVVQMGLIFPQITFLLNADGKNILMLNKCNSKEERIKQLFPELINKFNAFTKIYENYRGEAFISLPDLELQNFSLFAVNKRPVKDRLFYKAINDFYSGQRKRPPFIFIEIHVPENEVDVNVHPTKREVRFKDNTNIYNFLRTLLEGNSVELSPKNISISQASPLESTYPTNPQTPNLFENQISELNKPYLITEKHYRIIGSFAKGYLLVEKDETLLIIDQHAAHERIIFDKLVNQFKKNSITPQVIVPYVFTPKVSTAILLEELRLTLLNLGYTFEQINSQSYALTSIPPFISYDTAIKTFLELIEDKEILKKQTDLAYKTFANLACKEAVKKNEQLTTEEVEHLLFHTFNEGKLYCPHGRNFIIEISLQDLEKRFGRKD